MAQPAAQPMAQPMAQPAAQPMAQPAAGPVRPQPLPTAPPPVATTVPGMYSDIPAGAEVMTAGGRGTAPATAPNGAVLSGPVNPNQAVVQAPPAPAIATPVPEGGTASTLGSVQNQPYVEQFFKNQNDPATLAQLRSDPNTPDWLKKIAAKQDYQQLKFQQETNEAEQKLKTDIESGDTRAIAKAITDKKDDGNIALAFLYGLIGFQSGANAEVEKWKRARGIGATWQPGQLGEDSVAIKVDPDGSVREGVFTSGANQGKSLSNKELILTYGQGTPGGPGKALKADVGAMYEKLDDKGNVTARGRLSSKFVNGRTITGIESGGKFMSLDPSWRQEGISVSAQKAIDKANIEFITKPSIKAAEDLLDRAALADPGDGSVIRDQLDKIKKQLPNFEPSPQIKNQISTPATKEKVSYTGENQAPGMISTVFNPEQDQGGMIKTAGPVGKQPNESWNAYDQRMALEKKRQEAGIEVGKELTVAEKKPPAEQKGKNAAKDINDQRQADETYKIIQPISEAIKKSTGSGIGSGVDALAGVIGVGTEGAKNIAKLEVLGYKLLQQVPRMEGAQSNIDVGMYKQAAGDLANDKKPIEVRLEALATIIEMLKNADKEKRNDWSYGSSKPVEFRVIKREKIQ